MFAANVWHWWIGILLWLVSVLAVLGLFVAYLKSVSAQKYPNRRLYDTKTSSYITLADVKQMVLKQEDFQVVDAKSGDDLTRQILLQIILEEESGGMPMFSSDLLSQLIRSYGNAMQGMMGSYLERNIRAFQDIQKALQEQSSRMVGDNSRASSGASKSSTTWIR